MVGDGRQAEVDEHEQIVERVDDFLLSRDIVSPGDRLVILMLSYAIARSLLVGAVGVGNPLSVRSELPGPNDYNWSLDVQVKFVFPGTKYGETMSRSRWGSPIARFRSARRRSAFAASPNVFPGGS